MPEDENSKRAILRSHIEAWKNRAARARQQGNDELAQLALDRKILYENELAKLQEFDIEK